MATKTLNGVKVLNIVRTKTDWQAETKVPSKGILLVETDGSKVNLKIGDGVNRYSLLPYASGEIDLSNYYTIAQTDAAISTAIAGIGNVISIKGVKATVGELPTTGNKQGDLWFVGGSTVENKDEYVWTAENKWEKLGSTATDLSGYYTKTEVNTIITRVDGDISGLASDIAILTNEFDDLEPRVVELETNAIKDTDTLILNCTF